VAYRLSAGRPLTVPRAVRDARGLIRQHLRGEGRQIKDLAGPWDMHLNSTYRRFYDKRPFTPQMIDVVIETLKLDEFDAYELRLQAAIEAGWQLNIGEKL
jgi:hypothetical protein